MPKAFTSTPILSKKLFGIVSWINRFFDRLYHSKYNPLYRSGTLAVGFLSILLITGVYLCFFYSVGSPYSSVLDIQNQVWMGRWIRALHRYATDGVIVATFFHVLQLLTQGKTWGPRTLAWISGVVLVGALLVSAWSGYVMVWDTHGQLLAMSGAKMLQGIPFLRDTLGLAFNGSSETTSSFFFMNLFLHVAIPLGMIFGIWVHTARLARTVWFPESKMFIWTTISFILLSILWPAPLPGEANLLEIIGTVPVDIFTGFWIPISDVSHGKLGLISWGLLALIAISLPWWWRPSQKSIPGKSVVDVNTCSGCTQCVRDCPYEAINMIPRTDGKRLLANVSNQLCVSCGICAASCDDRAIGPEGRTAIDQMKYANDFLSTTPFTNNEKDIVVILCDRNGYIHDKLKETLSTEINVFLYPVECCGTVHSDVIELILSRVGGVFLLGCPARNCTNRDGLVLISERVYERRVPFLSKKIERRRIYIDSAGDGEIQNVLKHLREFGSALSQHRTPAYDIKFGSVIKRIAVTAMFLSLIAAGSQVKLGTPATEGILRVGTRMPGRAKVECRPISEEEQKTIAKHMQRTEICQTLYISYKLQIYVDEKLTLSKDLHHSGARGDSPLFINEEVKITPGKHSFFVKLEPTQSEFISEMSLSFKDEFHVDASKIYLIKYDASTTSLKLGH